MTVSTQLTQNPVNWHYLEFDDKGRAKLANTRITLSQLVQEKYAHGWSPEEIHFQHPELSLAAIYSAFSYYYAHQELVDRQIHQEQQEISELKAELKVMGIGHDSDEFRKHLRLNSNNKNASQFLF